jgi:hypothetical protein
MVNVKELADNIILAFQQESALLYKKASCSNPRAYKCKIDSCINDAYAGGLCNAHYLRKRNGKDLSTPLRHRNKNNKCRHCDKPVDAKGGWSLCKSHYSKRRREIMRSVCIDTLGGCCSKCGEIFPHYVYDFHHIGSLKKDFAISEAIKSVSAEVIASEVAKCILLCANCHRIEHHGEEQF